MPDQPKQDVMRGEEAPKAGMPGSGSDRTWWRFPSWTRSEFLHDWIRSGGILIAAAWGVYTFVWKDILVPSWQPAHLSLEASLTPVPGRPPSPDGLEMTFDVKGTNTSSRRVYLLANVWSLRGITRERRPASPERSEAEFQRESDEALQGVGLQHTERGVITAPGQLLAIGRLFDDNFIDPGDSVNRTVLVRIPKAYAAVELRVILPLLTRGPDGLFNGRRLVWGLPNAADGLPMLLLCPPKSDPASEKADCQAYDETADRSLQRFDPKKSTITRLKQFGLPPSHDGQVAPTVLSP
jgi:hypothetical protein